MREFKHSDEVQRIAETLITQHHQHLQEAQIAYLMKTYSLPAKPAPAPEVEKKRDPGIIYGSKPNGATIPPLTFRCEPCHAAFASQKQLDEHNKIRHNGSQAEDHKWQCDLCERVFATEDQLLDHVDLRHGR